MKEALARNRPILPVRTSVAMAREREREKRERKRGK